ncbi:hypothetical protein DMH08_15775 [Actinomadura sp. WAC 06369]|nr:hypothetical protein DMH08_15775 [Actinomadura sp. WAC 06369]
MAEELGVSRPCAHRWARRYDTEGPAGLHAWSPRPFLRRAAAFFAAREIPRIEPVLTDKAWCYRHSRDFAAALTDLGARHELIRPHCSWQNGKVERFNRTLAAEWAYRQMHS